MIWDTFSANFGKLNPFGMGDKATAAAISARILGLLISIPATRVAPSIEGRDKLCSVPSSIEGCIHTTQNSHRASDNRFKSGHDFRKAVNPYAASQLSCIMDNRLDAKHALAFAVDLGGQLSEVQLENCQIPDRFLVRCCSSLVQAKHMHVEYIQRSQTWTKRPTANGSLMVSATRSRLGALSIWVKQFASLVKRVLDFLA